MSSTSCDNTLIKHNPQRALELKKKHQLRATQARPNNSQILESSRKRCLQLLLDLSNSDTAIDSLDLGEKSPSSTVKVKLKEGIGKECVLLLWPGWWRSNLRRA